MIINQSESQRDLIARFRAECCLDRRFPIGLPVVARPEAGYTVTDYYTRKHETIGPGRFYGLHIVNTPAHHR
jgi:hypothetical protein